MPLDIGTLTGTIALEDQFSKALELVASQASSALTKVSGSFAGVALVATATATAVAAVTAAVTALGSRGSDVNDVAATLDHFAGSSENAAAVVEKLRAGTLGTVDNFTLMQQAARQLSAGVKLTADDFGVMGEAAFVLQNRGLGPTKDMLDLISDAMVTGRTRTLAMKLGVVDLGDAELNYANAHNKVVGALTDTEKAEAHRLQVMAMLKSAVQDAGAQQRDFGEQIEFAMTKIRNWVDRLSQAVAASPRVMKALDDIGKAVMNAFGGSSERLIQNIVGWIEKFAEGIAAATPYVMSFFSAIGKVFNFLSEHSEVLKTTAMVVGSFVLAWGAFTLGSTVVTGVLAAIGAIGTALTLATGPIGIVALAITGLVLAVQHFRDTMAQLQADSNAGKYFTEEGKKAEALTQQARDMEAAARALGPLQNGISATIGAYNKGMADASAATDKAAQAAVRRQQAIKDQLAAEEAAQKKLEEANQAIKENTIGYSQLTAVQRTQIIEYQRLNLSNDQIAAKLRISKTAVDLYLKANAEMLDNLRFLEPKTIEVSQAVAQLGERTFFLNDAFKTSDISSKAFVHALDSIGGSIEDVEREYARFLAQWRDQGPTMEEAGFQLGESLGTGLKADLQYLPNLIIGSLTGGGGMIGAIQGAGSMLGTTLGRAIGDGVKMLGSLGGPIGAAIGSLVGPLVGLIANIGGPSKKELEGREIEAQFEKQFGSFTKMQGEVQKTYIAIGRTAQDADRDIKAMLDAEKRGAEATAQARDKIVAAFKEQETQQQNINQGVNDLVGAFNKAGGRIPESLKASIESLIQMNDLTAEQKNLLQGVLDEAVPDYEKITNEAANYGITLDGLGQKFQQAATTRGADELFDFFDRARAAGAEVGGVLSGMSDEISAVVQQSIKFRTAIPENLRPLIEELARTNQLTDENGDAIQDISGLTFEESPLDKSIKSMNDAFDRLIRAIERLPATAAEAARNIPENPFRDWGARGPPEYHPHIEGMASGGTGRTTGPTWFYSGGEEDFAFSGEGKSFRNQLTRGGGGGGTVVIEIDRRRWAEIIVPELSDAIKRYGL